jgi:hypothetical protein
MRFRWRWLALAYLLLLIASHLVRWLVPVPPPALDPGERLLEVPVVGGTEPRTVRLAVQEWGPAAHRWGRRCCCSTAAREATVTSPTWDRRWPSTGR